MYAFFLELLDISTTLLNYSTRQKVLNDFQRAAIVDGHASVGGVQAAHPRDGQELVSDRYSAYDNLAVASQFSLPLYCEDSLFLLTHVIRERPRKVKLRLLLFVEGLVNVL